jgi:hypothetical protein
MRARFSLPFIIPLLLVLAACTSNPFQTAQKPEQEADALYGSYVIAKERGADLLREPSIPDTAKRPLARAMVASKDPADGLQDALNDYDTIKAQLAAGVTHEEKLRIAEQNIDEWIARARPLINDLVAIVGGLDR